jgi:hypothetical protein
VLAFDVDDCLEVFVLPIELATDVEDILIPFLGFKVIDRFGELVFVNGGVPY